MTPAQKPVITVVHVLPGRLRVQLSALPGAPCALAAFVAEHPGIADISFGRHTNSALYRFDPAQISREEVLIRTAFYLSREAGGSPVRILTEPEPREVAYTARYAAALLMGAFASRYLRLGAIAVSRLEMAAGIGTAAAILDHGKREFEKRGDVDPEVLSIVYLLSALIRGNSLPAAFVAWVTTFGRHIVRTPATGVEVQPMETPSGNGTGPQFEIVVTKDKDAYNPLAVFNLLPTLVKSALTGAAGSGDLLEEIRTVSRLHGEVLEGLGELRQGIPVRFRA